jgi:hypothetical protein
LFTTPRRATMARMDMTLGSRRIVAAGAAIVVAIALALPVVAASPSPAASEQPSGSSKPHGVARPDHSHAPEVSTTLHGTVARGADRSGHPTFTLTAGGSTYDLSRGPWWFWGSDHPLSPYVGKDVTVVGEREGDSTEIDVETIDGKALRTTGKPPWAGGPKVVGATHPGYKAWQAARDGAKNRGDGARPSASAGPQS